MKVTIEKFETRNDEDEARIFVDGKHVGYLARSMDRYNVLSPWQVSGYTVTTWEMDGENDKVREFDVAGRGCRRGYETARKALSAAKEYARAEAKRIANQ